MPLSVVAVDVHVTERVGARVQHVELAAFVREIGRGDPNVTSVALMRSKSKKPADE